MSQAIEYVTVDPEGVTEAVKLAIESQLFIPGWSLWHVYRRALVDTDSSYEIVLAMEGDKPLGICIADYERPCMDHPSIIPSKTIAFFVKEPARRRGIATKLLEKFKTDYGLRRVHASSGIKGSHDFFTKNMLSFLDQDTGKLKLFPHYRKEQRLLSA